MKRYIILLLAGLTLAIAAPSAFATRVIFDPSPGLGGVGTNTNCTISSGGLNNYTPCNVGLLDTPFTVSFLECSSLSATLSVPTGSTWCLYMDNVTGASLTSFTFQFTVPSPPTGLHLSTDGTDVLSCSAQPPDLASNDCAAGTTVSANQSLTIGFNTPPGKGIHTSSNFYLITDFTSQPGPATVTVKVPEPGDLGLFGLGLLAMGLGIGWTRRRRSLLDNNKAS